MYLSGSSTATNIAQIVDEGVHSAENIELCFIIDEADADYLPKEKPPIERLH